MPINKQAHELQIRKPLMTPKKLLRNVGPIIRTLQNTWLVKDYELTNKEKALLKNTFCASQDAQNAFLK